MEPFILMLLTVDSFFKKNLLEKKIKIKLKNLLGSPWLIK